jgi:hypothetical protein
MWGADVASGTPRLRRFAVQGSGSVLLFPADDSLAVVRQRLEGFAQYPYEQEQMAAPDFQTEFV